MECRPQMDWTLRGYPPPLNNSLILQIGVLPLGEMSECLPVHSLLPRIPLPPGVRHLPKYLLNFIYKQCSPFSKELNEE